jgi:PAS domain-containing protein
VELDGQLARELGLSSTPKRLADLAGEGAGFDQADLEALESDLVDVRLGGAPVRRQLRLAGRDRVVEMRAALAPTPLEPGTVLVWLFDISAADTERAKLAQRLQQTEGALDALTHLIESAPFPMWYRGPDLGLGLVNAAFVAAVEARDAADVIERGSELIDAVGSESARAGAEVALETGRPYSGPSPRRSDRKGGSCDWSMCRFPPARWQALRLISRTWRMRGWSLPATRNRSASWPIG